MRKSATLSLSSALALGCLALVTNLNCGGESGERPGATGGTIGTGGGPGTGGSGAGGTGGLDCEAAVEPANGVAGGVTDFSDWVTSSGKWGDPNGLYGAIYGYADANGSTMSAKVDTATKSLRAVGDVVANGYGGMGLSFFVCARVDQFTAISFDIMGSSPGCRMDLQIQTFDQRPSNQSPAGGCDPDSSCYNFPTAASPVPELAAGISQFTNVTIPLATVTSWSDDNARQVVGLQWQWGGTSVAPDPDGGLAACPIDVAITNVKFLP